MAAAAAASLFVFSVVAGISFVVGVVGVVFVVSHNNDDDGADDDDGSNDHKDDQYYIVDVVADRNIIHILFDSIASMQGQPSC